MTFVKHYPIIYIYGLRSYDSDVIQYVGQSKNPKKRLGFHFCRPTTGVGQWINAFRRDREKVVIEILDTVTPDNANQRERQLIAEWAVKNPSLLNRRFLRECVLEDRSPVKPEAVKQMWCDMLTDIKRHASAQGITQETIAEKTGLKASNISRILSGKYPPKLHSLMKIVKAIDARVEVI